MSEPVRCVCGGKPRVWSAKIEGDIWFSYVCECGIRSEYMPLLAKAKVVWGEMIHALKHHDALENVMLAARGMQVLDYAISEELDGALEAYETIEEER